MLLLHRAIHVLYVECSLNPLTADELLLVNEEMKKFKIPSTKDIAEQRRSRRKRKVGDTSAVGHSMGGDTVVVSSSSESSLKSTSGQKRLRVEEEDNIVLRISRTTSSYSDVSFLESIGPYLPLPKDEHPLSAIGLV